MAVNSRVNRRSCMKSRVISLAHILVRVFITLSIVDVLDARRSRRSHGENSAGSPSRFVEVSRGIFPSLWTSIEKRCSRSFFSQSYRTFFHRNISLIASGFMYIYTHVAQVSSESEIKRFRTRREREK